MTRPVRNKKPPWDHYMEAVCAIAGERLMICSCCLGWGRNQRLIGFGRCGQCNGTGYDIIGPVGLEALDIYRSKYEHG